MKTSIYLDRHGAIGKFGAVYSYLFTDGKASLEFEAVYPHEVEFLRDTSPKGGQLIRQKRYFGESLHGTDWPDRWLIRGVQAREVWQ